MDENYLVFKSQDAFESYERHHFAFQQSPQVGNYEIKVENPNDIFMELQRNTPQMDQI